MITHTPEQPWAIVLAGGNGTRLQGLTREIHGDGRPKQFSRILEDQSLLGHTRKRLKPVCGDDRLMFVVTKQHESFYAEELADVDPSRVLEQPANRGTAVAIMAALLQLLEREVDSIVGIFPSDHYYADDAAFAATVNTAVNASREHLDSIVLIGARPEWPEVEFGWIEPGASISSGTRTPLFGVNRFCEKPCLAQARSLMRNGGLWNTFITIGRARTFLKLFSATVLPVMSSLAEAVAQGNLDSVYSQIETIDFSKHVLSMQPASLLVMADNTSGWADLGNQARVIHTLDRNNLQPDWLREMRRSGVFDCVNEPASVAMRNVAIM